MSPIRSTGARRTCRSAPFSSLRDTNPSLRTDRTISIGDTITKIRGKQTLRFGGDFASIHADSRTDANARGSFVFTGLYTGIDFADFLLGLPQQATVQFGPGTEQFRSTSWDLFVQDDWRATDKITVNAGLRYEYFSPLSEADNRLVTLDAAPGFTAAVPVVAGGTGPYSGALPDTIVRPFRAGFAPRVGIAWRPKTGHGRAHRLRHQLQLERLSVHRAAARRSAAVRRRRNTVLGDAQTLYPIETALQTVQPGTTTNTYGVDPDYRLGYVQIWNLDVQRDLTRTVQLGVGYTGHEGLEPRHPARAEPRSGRAADSRRLAVHLGIVRRRLDHERADASAAPAADRRHRRRRHLHAVEVDRRCLVDRRAAAAPSRRTIWISAAERGLSSFDQRHRFAGDFTYELPFGATKRWLTSGMAAAIFGNWQLNGNVPLASGTPFTARVLGNVQDVAGGVNGTLRANYNGQPIAVSDPTSALFFNTAAFSLPAPGTFGNAGRNTIIGPGTSVLNLGLTQEHHLRPDARAVDPDAGQQSAQHRPVRVDRHHRQLADLRSGDGGPPDAADAAADAVPVLMIDDR